MKKAKQKLSWNRTDGLPVPRIYSRKARGKWSARLLIQCGDCDNKFEIYYGPGTEDLEIAGVLASVENWQHSATITHKSARQIRRGRFFHLRTLSFFLFSCAYPPETLESAGQYSSGQQCHLLTLSKISLHMGAPKTTTADIAKSPRPRSNTSSAAAR